MPVEFKLNGRDVVGYAHETLIQTAQRYGLEIPHLCYKEGLRPDGNCRACMVEIKGERVLAPSCCRKPAPGMEVVTDSDARRHRRRWCSNCCSPICPAERHTLDSELDQWARKLEVGKAAFCAAPPARIRSVSLRHRGQSRFVHPVHALRARVPRRAGQRRHRLRVPRRALEDRVRSRRSDGRIDLRRVRRVRAGVSHRGAHAGARCGHGAARQAGAFGVSVLRRRLPAHLQQSRTTRSSTSTAATGPSNHERLCVKGRYGFDYVHHRQRLTKPLIRKAGVPKHADFTMDPAHPLEYFREASWEEALDLAAGKLKAIRDQPRQGRACRASAPRRAPTRRRICSRNWCAPDSARTTSITARGCATPRASPR